MNTSLYEIVCTKLHAGETSPRESSLGFIAPSELEAAQSFCRHQNALVMYNNSSPEMPRDFRLRPAVHPKLLIEDDIIIVDVFDSDQPSVSKTMLRSSFSKEHGNGANAVVFEHSYREILPVIDGEDEAHWAARFEAVVARGKAILKMQAETREMSSAI